VYIEFQLPHDESYGLVLGLLKVDIVDWATRYSIPYSQKTIKYTHRLGFNNEEYFSLFGMTWTSKMPFKIVRIENERY
jgi:hypothetical protein